MRRNSPYSNSWSPVQLLPTRPLKVSLLSLTVATPVLDLTDAVYADEATVEFRIFAQARKEEALSDAKFLRPITDVIMQSCKPQVMKIELCDDCAHDTSL